MFVSFNVEASGDVIRIISIGSLPCHGKMSGREPFTRRSLPDAAAANHLSDSGYDTNFQ
jgi:hypothetical protein